NQISTQGLSQHLLGGQATLARYGVSQITTHGITTRSQETQLGTASLCNRMSVGRNHAGLIRVDRHIAQQDSDTLARHQAVSDLLSLSRDLHAFQTSRNRSLLGLGKIGRASCRERASNSEVQEASQKTTNDTKL